MYVLNAEVDIVVHYSQHVTSHTLTIAARSTIKHLLTQVCKIIPGRVRQENVFIKHGNNEEEITNTQDYVILYSLDKPFHISKNE